MVDTNRLDVLCNWAKNQARLAAEKYDRAKKDPYLRHALPMLLLNKLKYPVMLRRVNERSRMDEEQLKKLLIDLEALYSTS